MHLKNSKREARELSAQKGEGHRQARPAKDGSAAAYHFVRRTSLFFGHVDYITHFSVTLQSGP